MSLQGFFSPGPYDDGDPVTGHYYEMAAADPDRAPAFADPNRRFQGKARDSHATQYHSG